MTKNILDTADAAILNGIVTVVHANAVAHGFWGDEDDIHNIPEKLALIHSEISEALEAYRSHSPKDKHVPQHDNFSVELADAVIRIFDLAAYMNIDIGTVLMDKHNYNIERPYKHGKKF